MPLSIESANYLIRGLLDSSIELHQILDEVPIGIAAFDLDRKMVLLNRKLEALTGFSNEEARSIQCRYVLRSALCHRGCLVKQLLERNGPIDTESDLINKNREKIPVRITAAPLNDVNGSIVGFIEFVEDLRPLRDCLHEDGPFFFQGKLIGKSHEMQRIFRILPVIAQTDSSVLITGETGTGKDFIAEAIHQSSNRAKGPFIKVNCGALPENLLESELFGHEKGAFTGAVEQKPGRFRLANMGTLYLTEIGDLPLNLQVKLLSFLDDRVLHPLGSTKGVHVDVRVIAATHRNLEQMARDGLFRQDLLFRLNVIRLHLPPLGKRGEDIKMLMEHFLQIFNPRFKKKIAGFTDEAKHVLIGYPYPGNVRELRNILEYAVNFCDGSKIQEKHLPEYILEYDSSLIGPDPVSTAEPSRIQTDSVVQRNQLSWIDTERQMILDAIIKARGRRSQAAKMLGMGRSTLWRKMKKYGVMPQN